MAFIIKIVKAIFIFMYLAFVFQLSFIGVAHLYISSLPERAFERTKRYPLFNYQLNPFAIKNHTPNSVHHL